MIVKQRENRSQVEIFSIEEFVPSGHLLRKIDSAIDFTHICHPPVFSFKNMITSQRNLNKPTGVDPTRVRLPLT